MNPWIQTWTIQETYKKLKQLDLSNQYLDKALELLKPDKLILASIFYQKVYVNLELNKKREMDIALKKYLENSTNYDIYFGIASDYDEENKKSFSFRIP